MSDRPIPIGMTRLNMAATHGALSGASGLEVWDGMRWIAVVGLRLGTITVQDDSLTYGSIGGYSQRQSIGRRRVIMEVELAGAETGMWPVVDNSLLAPVGPPVTLIPTASFRVFYAQQKWRVSRDNVWVEGRGWSRYQDAASWARDEAIRVGGVTVNDGLRVYALEGLGDGTCRALLNGSEASRFSHEGNAIEWVKRQGAILLRGMNDHPLVYPEPVTEPRRQEVQEPAPSGRALDL